MSRIALGNSHPRPCSGEKTLRRCRNNGVVLIDVDDDDDDCYESVIIVDVPEPLPRKRRGPSTCRKEKKSPSRNVIYIDDDETPLNNHSGSGVQNGDFSAGASSSMKSNTAAPNNVDDVAEEHQFVKENTTPVRLSKCKRTYSGKASTRNHFGLSSDSENDSSDGDDYPDCELMEDSSGKVQEQWEKAFSRRRKDINSSHLNNRDPESSSRRINEIHHQNIEAECEIQHCKRVPLPSRAAKVNEDYKATSSFSTKEDDIESYRYSDHSKLHAVHKTDYQAKESHVIHPEPEGPEDCEPGIFSRSLKERWKHPAPCSYAEWQQSAKEVNCVNPASEDKESPNSEAYPSLSESSDDDICRGNVNEVGNDATMPDGQCSFENEVDSGRSFPGDDGKNFQWQGDSSCEESGYFESSQSHATDTGMGEDKLVPGKSSDKKSGLSHNETNKDCSSLGDERLQQEYSVSNCSLVEREEHLDDQLINQCEDGSDVDESCLLGDREKHKETDLYKRAREEELARQQQALLMQAEEAQHLKRLRKRRKAESMRLMDMERRQKQRVEEMRSSQKQVEENMNLKESIRAEVMGELRKLELSCHNMASLLNSLGIPVGSWPSPLPHEVQAAYKKALLTFHPDRAARSDIRQQVEAEEKFKLVNRLKEKFLPCG